MLLSLIAFFISSNANAWDKHQVLLQHLMDSRASKKRIYPYQKIVAPCSDAERKELDLLGSALHFNAAKVHLFSESRCKPNQLNYEVLVSDILGSSVIDEPDLGMDQDLLDVDDPLHERNYMGGVAGPTSQGFRHMYFSGMELFSPFKTFQFPPGKMGQALERIKTFREVSNAYFLRGDKFWGTRTLLWELHYIQDLQQPFHVVQVPVLAMLPWNKLFKSFIKESARTLGNYHYAYEGLALALANEASTNHFAECFEPEEGFETIKVPAELIAYPRSQSSELTGAVYDLFGPSLKDSGVDLANGVGALDYFEFLHLSESAILPDEELKMLSTPEKKRMDLQRKQFKAMGEIKQLTCDLMHRVSALTWDELDRSQLTPKGSAVPASKTEK